MAVETHTIKTHVNAHNGTSSGVGQVYVDGKMIASSGVRGHTVYVLDKDTLALVSKNSYDTYKGYTSDKGLPSMGALLAQLNSIDTDNFVVITTADAITNDAAFRTALARFGLPSNANILCSAARRAFAFIGQLGLAAGSAPYKLGEPNQSFDVNFTVGYGTLNPPTSSIAGTMTADGKSYALFASKSGGKSLVVRKGDGVYYKAILDSGAIRCRNSATSGYIRTDK